MFLVLWMEFNWRIIPCARRMSPSLCRPSLSARQRHSGTKLRQRRTDVQGELVTVSTECCHDKMHFVFHEPGDEVHVSRQAVDPRDDQRAPRRVRLLESRRKSGSADCKGPEHALQLTPHPYAAPTRAKCDARCRMLPRSRNEPDKAYRSNSWELVAGRDSEL
jgi:hypothetical protein